MLQITLQPLSQLTAEQLATKTTFDCGQPALNNYLINTAKQHDNKNITRSFCAIKEDNIIGYYSLSNATVDINNLPQEITKRYKLPKHDMPVVRLCRLAIDSKAQRQGIGEKLLIDALEKVLSVAKVSGCVGMVVDAKDQAVANYYQGYGFVPAPDNPLLLFMPLPTIQELFAE